jgi:hypothetical protein
MAKDLPYFKFFCSEWSDGDITLEDFETQGLFINICAYYWSNECVVEYNKLVKKFKGYDLAISNLLNANIIKVKDSFVSISFLDEQLEDREKLSKQNSKNIKEYWEKKRALNDRNTSVSISINENDSIKRREDKIKKDNIKPTAFSFFNSLVSLGANKQLVNDWIAVRKTKKATNTETAFNKFKKEFELSGHTIDEVLEKCVEKSWSGFNADWFKKENVNLQPNGIGRTNQKLMIYKND